MSGIGSITVFREKTIIDQQLLNAQGGQGAGQTIIRSNRVALALRGRMFKENITVRGQNLPDTLRIAALVVDEFRRHRTILKKAAPMAWSNIWRETPSNYEGRHNPRNWIAIYGNGQPLFSTMRSGHMDFIEKHAPGTEINEKARAEMIAAFRKLGLAVRISHQSQTAVVVSEIENMVRCAILERSGKRTSSFSFSVTREKPEHYTVGNALNMASNFVEVVNLSVILNRTAPSSSNQKKLLETSMRRRELISRIHNFERTQELKYRPDRPVYLE